MKYALALCGVLLWVSSVTAQQRKSTAQRMIEAEEAGARTRALEDAAARDRAAAEHYRQQQAAAANATPKPAVTSAVRPSTGSGLLRSCESADSLDQFQCATYILGVADSLVALAVKDACVPTGVDMHQAARVFVKFGNAHPELLHMQTPLLFTAAIREAFPCSKPPAIPQPSADIVANTDAAIEAFTVRHSDWKQYEQVMLEVAKHLTPSTMSDLEYMEALYAIAKSRKPQ